MGRLAATGPFDTVLGLPTHPLVVHAVVVLLPLVAIGAIAIALSPRLSRRFGILVWPLAGVATLSAMAAEQTGEAMAARVGWPAVHAQLGEQVKYLGAALIVVTMVLWLLDRQTPGPRPLSVRILAAVVIVIAVMAIVWTVRSGDTGARAVWGSVVQESGRPAP